MKDFIFNNACKVYFGRGFINELPKELEKFGKRVLLCYGGGSIKKIGLYDKITSLLNENGFKVFELGGIVPNPRHELINRGAEICKKEGVNVILAVGAGSTIDSAKGIAAVSVSSEKDVWKFVKERKPIENALPIISVLTNAATGSEMDELAVISNLETKEKLSIGGSALLPKVTFENPEYSYSLSPYQTACGAFDIISHVLDKYYFAGENTFDMILEFQEAVMRAVYKWAPIALNEPDNYEARANLTWASSMALNSILDAGGEHSAACHAIEHELSAYYDITHGHGLAIVTPRWLRYILNESTASAIYRLGEKVFGVEGGLNALCGANKTIEALEEFCTKTLNLKGTLKELGIDDKYFKEMAKHAVARGKLKGIKVLDEKDVENILNACL